MSSNANDSALLARVEALEAAVAELQRRVDALVSASPRQ
jgi:uncharacterized protein YceH (UPF0502 family)